MFSKILLVTLLLITPTVWATQPWPQEEVTTYCKKELIQGRQFVYRHELRNGTLTKSWTVDDRTVSHREYIQEHSKAEMEARTAQLLAQQELQDQELAAQVQLHISGHKRLLTLTIAELEEQLHKLYDYRLEPYYSFSPETFASRSLFDEFVKQTVPEAKKLLSAREDITLNEYQSMIKTLEDAPQKLSKFLHTTTDNAIKQCNDTKILKDLLALTA